MLSTGGCEAVHQENISMFSYFIVFPKFFQIEGLTRELGVHCGRGGRPAFLLALLRVQICINTAFQCRVGLEHFIQSGLGSC